MSAAVAMLATGIAVGSMVGAQRSAASADRGDAVPTTRDGVCHHALQLAYSDRGIVVSDIDGSNFRRLTQPSGRYGDFVPSWSPDGKRIAFERVDIQSTSFATEGDLYIVGADGRGLRKRVPGGLEPSWSPDGRRILYVVTTGHDDYWQIVEADSTGRRIDLPSATRDAAWSPDGRQLALATESGVEIVDADGRRLRRITSGEDAEYVAWAPDGRSIAFATRQPDTWVAVVRVDGSRQTVLFRARPEQSPGPLTWSPDATRIAFAEYHAGHNNIDVVNADGTGRKVVAEHDGNSPTWSPDGNWLEFTPYDQSSDPSIYLVRPRGTHLHKLPKRRDGEAPSLPNWRPC